jgi:pimeloyl-ACP methyl ester carboxylesterase
MVLVHGAGPSSSWRTWERNLDGLAARHRVCALDLPGHGESDPEPAPVEGFGGYAGWMAHRVCRFVQEAGVAPAVLVGLSAGGAVCMELAGRWPEAVAGLVLVDSTPPGAAGWAFDVGRLKLPVCIIWETDDQGIPVEHGQRLAPAIPGSTLYLIDPPESVPLEDYRGGHHPQWVQPEVFTARVLEFTQALARTGTG